MEGTRIVQAAHHTQEGDNVMRITGTVLSIVLLIEVATLPRSAAAQNLLRNPGFETVPANQVGEGILPTDWQVINVTPDTYSNDSSFGLSPGNLGNFTGVAAHSGLRWVAGWSSANEIFGQTLTNPLTPGVTYQLDGFLHQAVRPDLAQPGAYNVFLADGPARTILASLGGFSPTDSPNQWQARSFTFTAPANAGSLPVLIFVPYSAGTSSYPGLDDVSLTVVSGGASAPEPATLGLVALGLAGFLCVGLRKQRRRL